MQQTNPPPSEVKESIVVGSIRLQEIPFKVKSPVFEDVVVKVPKFVEEQVIIPVGFDKIVSTLALDITKAVLANVEKMIIDKLDKAIDERVKEIKTPKFVEELVITHKDVNIDRPVYKDVEIDRPLFVDKEVVNPILKNVEIINAVIVDQTVINAVIVDQTMTNAIIKDVEVERAVIREKVVDVIHPRYLDLKGNPL